MAQFSLDEHHRNIEKRLGQQVSIQKAEENDEGWKVLVSDGGWSSRSQEIWSYDNGRIELK